MYPIVKFILTAVRTFVDIMAVLIIIRVLLNWLVAMGKGGNMGQITYIIYDVTEPIIGLAKKLPHRVGMIDLSPIIALLGLDLFEYLITIILTNL